MGELRGGLPTRTDRNMVLQLCLHRDRRTIGATLTSAFCAYGFAVLQARGSRLAFGMVLLTILVPYQVLIIPEYIVWAKLGLINTPLPILLPWFLGGGAFNIFLLRQFMLGLPRDMVDAARVDGANELHIFARIILPMCAPALAIVAVFHFIYMWNDFLRPLLYLPRPLRDDAPRRALGIREQIRPPVAPAARWFCGRPRSAPGRLRARAAGDRARHQHHGRQALSVVFLVPRNTR